MKKLGEADQVAWFMVFVHFAGDVDRASYSLGVPPDALREVSQAYGWDAKLKKAIGSNSASGGELQRSVNRAINLVQAHRLRSIVDQLVQEYSADSAKLTALVTVNTAKGSYVDMTPVLNLAKAAQVAQDMTYRALGDTTDQTQRDERPENGGKDLSMALLKALETADRTPGLSSVDVVKTTLVQESKQAALQTAPKLVGGISTTPKPS